ncbi:triosephosphate isomerase [Lampropedia cohaerens]|uniref:Triosephosphate isomerase n=1 Tax=Lampropedia cohaerens TaxID=1610491 RepID=A0A0U1PYN6_9BURK|nr:triose-phosphate isomerase [Lampropedia cohaerens]KKW67586.1 triosephosphate isomerase [Lampropedia cohaerens]
MGRKLVVGNWKMNGSLDANAALVRGILDGLPEAVGTQADVRVAVAPPAVYLAQLQALLQGQTLLQLAAQDVSAHAAGAFTGDVAAAMLAEFDVRYVIVGHSERRKYQQESDAVVAQKAAAARAAGLVPIVCLGETLQERDAGQALAVVQRQLQAVLTQPGVAVSHLVLAYEPVWAIGTGRTASPEQAQEVHAALRRLLGDAAEQVAILYGGSMNAGNAAQLLAQADIDGGLIGGAALKAHDFLAIVHAAAQQ